MEVLALAGAIPAVVLMALVERADAKRPEPRWQLRKVALFGGLITLPCIAAEWLLEKLKTDGTGGALFDAFIVAALVEESAKALALYVGAWKHPAFDERLDGIVYATRAGLGFALVENVGYLLSSETMTGFVGMFIMRAVLAVPGHAIWSGFVGHYAAKKRFDGTGPGALGGLLLAVAMHGAYDGAIFLIQLWGDQQPLVVLPLLMVPLVVVFGGFFWLRALAKEALWHDDLDHHEPARLRLPFGVGFVLR